MNLSISEKIYIYYALLSVEIFGNIDMQNVRYAYSAMAQVLAAILAITLTFRLIFSQRLRYRFPLNIVGSLGWVEKIFIFSGVILTSLSIIFLMFSYKGGLPSLVVCTVIWIVLLPVYYYYIKARLEIENLLKIVYCRDSNTLKKKRKGFGVAKEPKLFLYDLAIQSINQKDFQLFEMILARLASLSTIVSHLIVNKQIGEICKQYIDNPKIFQICCKFFYRLISPTRIGIKSKLYFFDKKEDVFPLKKDVKAYINNMDYGKSSIFSIQNCTQVILTLNEIVDRFFSRLDRKEKEIRYEEIAIIIVSSLADFCTLDVVNSQTKEKPGSHNKCKDKLISFLINELIRYSDFYESIIENATKEVVKELNVSVIYLVSLDDEDNKLSQVGSSYINSVRAETKKLLELLLRENLVKSRFDFRDAFLNNLSKIFRLSYIK